MKCREATLMIDLGFDKSLWGKIRLYSHLLHCHACRWYLEFSRSLRSMAQSRLSSLKAAKDIQVFNLGLMQKFARPEKKDSSWT